MKPSKRAIPVIGVTGGAGSGKSTLSRDACRVFPVRLIRADDVGRILMEPGKSVYRALVASYGDRILLSDGRIDRKALSAICFSSAKEQKKLNAIEHPLIREEIAHMIHRTRKPAVLLEAALLVEGGLTDLCERIIFVKAGEAARKERLKKERGYSAERSSAIFALQARDNAFLKIATDIVENGASLPEAKRSFRETVGTILSERGIL